METLLKNSPPSHSRDLEDAVESIQTARRLHEQLIERSSSPAEKAKCARDIANLLCNVEAGRNLAVHLRHSLARLRADAENRAGLTNAEGLRSPSEVWDHYERLQAAAM
ncbi:MAG TPA: hypothetical protein VM680_16555 [Verrucomicrobiae bacterium]|nr:hypothetical protein [Verrucomicrobiae bacterium]